MTKSNPHIGSSFENWLEEEGISAEVTTAAIKSVLALQLTQEMQKKGMSKSLMASRMKTSRAQLDRLLDPHNQSVTLDTLQRAAHAVGKQIKLELI
jgi:predicted XRE-type DNA-binding protein